VEILPTIEEDVSKIQHLEIKPHIELMEEKIKTANLEVSKKPLVV
jgi:hypothetical protein